MFTLLLSFGLALSAQAKECGRQGEFQFCYYPGDASSTRVVYFFHGYGDNSESWGRNWATPRIEKRWKETGAKRPHVINLSKGAWWYTEKEHGQKLSAFVAWFETRFDFTVERALYGESMGGHNAYRWSLDAPGLFARAAYTCPAVPKRFVKDQPVGPGSGFYEWLANQMIDGAYNGSSQPDFNMLEHSLNEKETTSIAKAYVLVLEEDHFGFYDGGMALHRALAKESDLELSLEVQKVKHCEHDVTQLADFLVAL